LAFEPIKAWLTKPFHPGNNNCIMSKRRQQTVRLLRPPQAEAGILCIREGAKASFYVFAEIPCAIGGRGFAVHRLGLGPLYHVRIASASDCSCECLGFLRHGHCKHVRALLTLAEQGLI
jgi:hypothetical protein